ncbi:hypothetical protein KSP39_PZI006922 [Platanthera zijinensis]|uniref:Auxin-repressed protein n=1 Tax=Platanthera zijinensis TaxID=2320716 RepID=A0AAP0G9H6_9ASPA
MVLLEKLWDDVIAGPHPENGLGKLRRKVGATKPLVINHDGEGNSIDNVHRSPRSMLTSPTTPASPATTNVWRGVFHPGSNINTKTLGANLFDKPQPNSPTVYDWYFC